MSDATTPTPNTNDAENTPVVAGTAVAGTSIVKNEANAKRKPMPAWMKSKENSADHFAGAPDRRMVGRHFGWSYQLAIPAWSESRVGRLHRGEQLSIGIRWFLAHRVR